MTPFQCATSYKRLWNSEVD